jgi:hypothetical protein
VKNQQKMLLFVFQISGENIKTALYFRSLPTSLKFNKDGLKLLLQQVEILVPEQLHWLM